MVLVISLIDKNKDIMRVIKQTVIDTISNILGIIDGSSTLKACSFNPKLLIESIDTRGEMQGSF